MIRKTNVMHGLGTYLLFNSALRIVRYPACFFLIIKGFTIFLWLGGLLEKITSCNDFLQF